MKSFNTQANSTNTLIISEYYLAGDNQNRIQGHRGAGSSHAMTTIHILSHLHTN